MSRSPVASRLAAAFALVVLAGALVGCGQGTTTPPEITPDPKTTSIVSGRFELRFTIDRTTLRPGDPITGTAELHLRAGGSGALSGSSSLFGFEYMEVGGEHRQAFPIYPSDCAPHQVGADSPLSTPLLKAGGGDVSIFPRETTVRLPPGDWDITAIAGFGDGRGCRGQPFDIRATLRVRVNP